MKSSARKLEKEIGTLVGVLEAADTSSFKFYIDRKTDSELGLIEITAVWKAELDEVMEYGKEYTSTIETIVPSKD
jgi:hypothetical protein